MAIETLVCQACGEQFERERTRGRKPKRCPDCKDSNKKPKQDSKPEVIYKGEEEPQTRESDVVDMATGKRDPNKVPDFEVEIPDDAEMIDMHRLPKYLSKYDRVLVDGKPFSAGTVVKVKNHEHNGCRFEIRAFVKNTRGPLYFDAVGAAGHCLGKYRVLDPWRVHK